MRKIDASSYNTKVINAASRVIIADAKKFRVDEMFGISSIVAELEEEDVRIIKYSKALASKFDVYKMSFR